MVTKRIPGIIQFGKLYLNAMSIESMEPQGDSLLVVHTITKQVHHITEMHLKLYGDDFSNKIEELIKQWQEATMITIFE